MSPELWNFPGWGSHCFGRQQLARRESTSTLKTQDLLGAGSDSGCTFGGPWRLGLAPPEESQWVGGKTVNKVVSILKHHLFHLTPFGLYWGVLTLRSAPLPSRTQLSPHQVENHLLIPALVTGATPCEQGRMTSRAPFEDWGYMDCWQPPATQRGSRSLYQLPFKKKRKKEQHLTWRTAWFIFRKW